jgi:hypothetical protein
VRKFAEYGSMVIVAVLSICFGARSAGAAHGSSLKRLKGSYAGIFSGKANTGTELLPLLGTGIFVADGNGHLSGHETYTFDTTPCEAEISGTYTINPDGSGTDSITFAPTTSGCTGGSYTQSLAIAEGGKLVLLSNTNGDQINEEWRLQR